MGQAQIIEWFEQKHDLESEQYTRLEYISSASENPVLVTTFITTIPNTVPQGQSYSEYFIIGHDTNGQQLWSKQVHGQGELLPDGPDRFWFIIGGGDSIKIGNQWIHSNNTLYSSRYFVEMDAQGNVVSHFTQSLNPSAGLVASDFALDGSGNILMTGFVSFNGNMPQVVSFANFTDTLDIFTEYLLYVARMDDQGNELDFLPIYGTNNLPYGRSASGYVEYNPHNGLIYFDGGLGDTLWFPDTVITDQYTYREPFIGVLNNQFELVNLETYHLSDFGGRVVNMAVHPGNHDLYCYGSWGDTFHFMPDTVIAGHPGTVNNAYVARLDPTTLEVKKVRTFEPVSHSSYSANMSIFDHSFDLHGNLHIGGYIMDSVFVSQDTTLTYFTATNVIDMRKSFYMSLSPDLDIRYDLVPEDNESVGFYQAVAVDEENNDIYLAGHFAGPYVLKQVSTNTPTQWFDAMLLSVEDTAAAPIDTLTAVAAIAGGVQIQLYPNPNKGAFEIAVDQTGAEDISVTALDISGRQVTLTTTLLEKTPQGLRLQCRMTESAAGLYLIRVGTADNHYTMPVVLE